MSVTKLTVHLLHCHAIMHVLLYRIGDKRPDKDGIYLPTCLTELAIYSRMKEEIGSRDESEIVCFSQFNKIFRKHFPNVTIPKVHYYRENVQWWEDTL